MNKIILILVLILVFGVGLWFVYYNRQFQLRPPTLPTPTPEIQTTLRQEGYEIKNQLTKTDKKIGDLTLENNADFKIDYLISNDQFIVTIKNPSYSLAKQKAETWFTDKGFLPGELCVLKLSFAASKEIKPDFSQKDAVPQNCPVPPLVVGS